jgi:hypothetical protein
MSEDKNTENEDDKIVDENVHFDMYHFYKRKDVVFVGIVLIVLLIVVLYLMTGGEPAGV